MKSHHNMNEQFYPAFIHGDDAPGYGISFPDFRGCTSAGDTLEKVIAIKFTYESSEEVNLIVLCNELIVFTYSSSSVCVAFHMRKILSMYLFQMCICSFVILFSR